ncbi:MAG: MscL family protein [Patescibacteria group bacterium]|jgi:large-conductance mechanosensitive channel
MIDQIEKLKEIKPLHQINKEVGGFFGRLIAFLKEYSVIGIAIGVIVAQAAKDFVDALVSGVFIPALNLLIPNNELSSFSFLVRGIRFDLGSVFSSFITLLIIIVFLFLLFKGVIRRAIFGSIDLEEKKLEK